MINKKEKLTFSSAQPPRTIKVEARGEIFKIVQLRGNLFVCSKAHGNCCCGWTEKGRAPVNTELWGNEWENRRLRNKLHLSFTGCLGPCAVGNTVLLQLDGRSIWFKDLNGDHYIGLIFNYIEDLLADPITARPDPLLNEHIYERYLPATTTGQTSASFTSSSAEARVGVESKLSKAEDQPEAVESNLEGLDPVCLMEVDPATARWQSEYQGHSFYFCAPSCKKLFEAKPQAYL